MNDLKLSDDLDLIFENGDISNCNNESTLITYLLTDDRFNNQNGYWMDIPKSLLWITSQNRNNNELINLIKVTLDKIIRTLIDDKVYRDVNYDISTRNSKLNININISLVKDDCIKNVTITI